MLVYNFGATNHDDSLEIASLIFTFMMTIMTSHAAAQPPLVMCTLENILNKMNRLNLIIY